VKHLIVDGRMIVEDGQLLSVDLPRLIDHQRKLAEALVG
jgi:hypothetical protein